MDLLLVLSLTLSFLTTGLSDTKDSECTRACPAGSHSAGKCGNDTYRCRPCETNSFTELPNQRSECLKCSQCEKHAKQIKACVPDSNVVCACIDGFYSDNSDNAKDCKRCPCEECQRNNIKRKCLECKRCLNDSNCIRQCKIIPTSTSTTLSANLTMAMDVQELTTAGNPGPHKVNQVSWIILVAAVASLLLLLWLLLVFLKKPGELTTKCSCWAQHKEQEPPAAELKSNEQFSHQNSSPCIMIFTTSEETPIPHLSLVNPEHPDSIAPLLPSPEQQKDEQAEAWPAVVLYAIIREVPLRRWKEFLRLLSVSDQQMARVELEAGLNSVERQYQMLRLWSQRSTASLDEVLCALRRMELSGCAQLLQESLEEMRWTPGVRLQVEAADPAGGAAEVHREAASGKNVT